MIPPIRRSCVTQGSFAMQQLISWLLNSWSQPSESPSCQYFSQQYMFNGNLLKYLEQKWLFVKNDSTAIISIIGTAQPNDGGFMMRLGKRKGQNQKIVSYCFLRYFVFHLNSPVPYLQNNFEQDNLIFPPFTLLISVIYSVEYKFYCSC